MASERSLSASHCSLNLGVATSWFALLIRLGRTSVFGFTLGPHLCDSKKATRRVFAWLSLDAVSEPSGET